MKFLKYWLFIIITLFVGVFGILSLSVEAEAIEDTYASNNTNRTITFDKSVGINAFIDDPLEIMKVAGVIREYHNYSWTYEKVGEHKFSPSNVKWWSFDDYYKKLYEAGIVVSPCIQGTSKAVVTNMTDRSQKPINDDEDSLDPFSYSEHAATMYQYAARYGSTKVDDSKLMLADDQERVSGLGYLQYYEDWNEPDNSWSGPISHFSPQEFAAMLSADYDGHEGRLGDTYGVKNADPNAKLVAGGVAGGKSYVNTLNEIREWALENRTDKALPFDVLNFHMYVGKNSPENSTFISDIEKINTWRNTYASDKEIWMTEFGWDTNINSAHGASYEDQRDWLMRTYLIANAHGIDRSTMYMIRDAGNQSDSGKYSTSGLTTKKDEWNKKTSWYGVYTLKNVLTDYLFESIIKETEDIYIYKFINKNTNEECYVLWSPTEDDTTIIDYSFNVGDNTNVVTLTEFVDNETNGSTTNLNVVEDKVNLTVGETPIFVKVSRKEVVEEPTTEPTTEETTTTTTTTTKPVEEVLEEVVTTEPVVTTTTTTTTKKVEEVKVDKTNKTTTATTNNMVQLEPMKSTTKKVTTKSTTEKTTNNKSETTGVGEVSTVINLTTTKAEKKEIKIKSKSKMIILVVAGLLFVTVLVEFLGKVKKWID